MSDWGQAAWLMLAGSTLMLMIGMPVAFTFIGVNLMGAWIYMGHEPGLIQLVRSSVSSVASFALTPIPLFVLMGEVLFHTGIALKVIEGIEHLISRIPGRLAVVAVVSGTVFSAISGSTIATTAMLGSLMLPVMLARGYHPTLASGPIMAIGAVDMLIPPSALTVLLGSLSGISISKLLIGGVLPGIILSIAFVIWIVVRVMISPELAPHDNADVALKGWPRYRLFVLYVLPTLCIFGVVVGALAQGWATPTECAALGAFATLVQATLFRVLKWSSMIKALQGTASISGMILFIILGATTFAQILSFSGASTGLVQWIIGQGLSRDMVIMGMMLVLIVLGIFVDQVSMMMITLPIFVPVVRQLGYDDVWFAVTYLINIEIAGISPPFGLSLFVMIGVASKGTTMADVYKAAIPFCICSLVAMALIILIPQIALWLPSFTGSR